MSIKVKFPADGGKNLTVQVTGVIDKDLEFQVLFKAERRFRIDSVLFSLQEKMGVLLWWDEKNLILPLESRGYFSFVCPITPDDKWEKTLYISTLGVEVGPCPKHFYFTLDCEKL